MTSTAQVGRNESQNSGSRRSSSLSSRLFRSKSGEQLGDRKSSGNRLKKGKVVEEEAKVNKSPPKLPGYTPQPLGIQTFGGESHNPRSASRDYQNGANSAPPVPPLPGNMAKDDIDPYARAESMTHRGRYSYAHSTTSTVNSPRRVRRRKDPTPFNVLIIGAKNSGKTSFLNFLKSSLALPARKQPHRYPDDETPPPSSRQNRNFTHHYQEIEVDAERVGLTLWDSQGLDKSIVDLQLRDMSNFVESKFDDSFIEEMKVVRSPGVKDTHIHCVFLILDPSRLDMNIQAAQQGVNVGRASKVPRIIGALDEDFDLQVLRNLQGKTTVVPVISKADTITTAHMDFLKERVWESLKRAGLDPLEALNFDADYSDDDKIDEQDEDDDDSKDDENSSVESTKASPETAHTEDSDVLPGKAISSSSADHGLLQKNQQASTLASGTMLDTGYIPMSILSPDQYSLDPKDGPVGRKFPWGFADPYNPDHCDFVKLKEACFGEWRAELREASREIFYERWRTGRLHNKGTGANGSNAPGEMRKASGGIPITLNRSKAR